MASFPSRVEGKQLWLGPDKSMGTFFDTFLQAAALRYILSSSRLSIHKLLDFAMYIERLKLNNFKAFRTADIELGKITVLAGANSSGKSSVISSLLGALQTENFPLYYSPNGDYVNMGDYSEMVYRHLRENLMHIGLEVSAGASTFRYEADYDENPSNRMPQLLSLRFESASLGVSIQRNGIYTAAFEYDRERDPRAAIYEDEALKAFFESLNKLTTEVTKRAEQEQKKPKRKKSTLEVEAPIWQIAPEPKGSFTFEQPIGYNEATREKRNPLVATQFRSLTDTLSSFNKRFNYISSFRLAPQRTYYQVSRAALKVGPYGDNYIDQISEWEFQRASEYQNLLGYLRDLGLLTDLRTRRMRGGRLDLLVKTSRGAVQSSLIDVGFGISQFLPILVADLQLGKGSTLAMSQPEIHLHPSVQAELATYLADRITKDGKRYIIETHSEYLINRLRLLIVRGTLQPDDVKVVYFRNGREGSETHKIEFTRTGEVKYAPRDFFETYMMDVMDIAMSATE
jgi:predicted ATPase